MVCARIVKGCSIILPSVYTPHPIQVGDSTTHFPLSPYTPGPLLISHLFLLTLLEFGIVYLIM